MSRVLVTGGSGFLGRPCIKHLLESGFEVHATYLNDSKSGELLQAPKLTWHKVNLLDKNASEALLGTIKATHMLHLAWYTEPGKFWDAAQNFDWLQASSGLLRAFAKAGGKRFVGAGTCAEYDWTKGTLSESTAILPTTLYGNCKSNFVKFAEPFCKENGISFAWARLFWLYGPGEDPRRLVPYVITSLLSGEEAQCTEGTQKRDYMHVDDAARACATILQSNKEGCYNIASGHAVPVAGLIGHVAKLLDKQALLKLGSLPTPAHEPPLIVADISKLYHEIGFRSEINLDSGLRESISWWQKKVFG